MSKGDWIIVVEPLTGYCLRCGESLALPLPIEARVWLAAMKAWEKSHRRCSSNPPEEARRLRQLTEGLVGYCPIYTRYIRLDAPEEGDDHAGD